MTTHEGKNKKRRTVLEGFNNVPDLLEKARQAVDELSQPIAETANKTPSPRRPKPASETKKGKKRIPKKAPQVTSDTPLPPAPDRPRAPLRTLDYYGIRIRHRLYGRIRLRIRKMKCNPVLAESITRGLNDVKGICDVEANAATGSLLVIFDPKEIAVPQSRRDFSALMEGFFPGLDTENLIRKFL